MLPVKVCSLLLASAALATAESFVLFAYFSGLVSHFMTNPLKFAVNARDGRFWIGPLQPTTHCPDFSGAHCPPSNTTVVDDLFRQLQVSKPGGQRVYADPDGVISYTPGGDSSITAMPAGSNFNAFYKTTVENPIFRGETHLLQFYKFGGDPAYSNIYACPDEKQNGMAYLRARWTSKPDAVWNSQCVALDGLLALPSDDKVGAYEYTRA
ncbi:putative secreted protein ARB_07637 [Colletotrichum liriopes]|uniref:Secreted protein ARB_07637 n=1 Tax=Colletotrichum liriopes TaxID=708192 RepID=A0AA37GFN1_9PEZI|nr:putative secreted protein ARB_07637 [Colletotrichum liriopes]